MDDMKVTMKKPRISFDFLNQYHLRPIFEMMRGRDLLVAMRVSRRWYNIIIDSKKCMSKIKVVVNNWNLVKNNGINTLLQSTRPYQHLEISSKVEPSMELLEIFYNFKNSLVSLECPFDIKNQNLMHVTFNGLSPDKYIEPFNIEILNLDKRNIYAFLSGYNMLKKSMSKTKEMTINFSLDNMNQTDILNIENFWKSQQNVLTSLTVLGSNLPYSCLKTILNDIPSLATLKLPSCNRYWEPQTAGIRENTTITEFQCKTIPCFLKLLQGLKLLICKRICRTKEFEVFNLNSLEAVAYESSEEYIGSMSTDTLEFRYKIAQQTNFYINRGIKFIKVER